MNIGEKVKQLREAKNWSQEDLAKRTTRIRKTKVSQQNINQLETGVVQQPRYLNALIMALGIEISDFHSDILKSNIFRSEASVDPDNLIDESGIRGIREQGKLYSIRQDIGADRVNHHIEHGYLEKTLEQLDSELPEWQALTTRRRARLIMTYYEDIKDGNEATNQGS